MTHLTNDQIERIRQTFKDIGLVGQLEIHMKNRVSVNWIGEPSEDDVLITISIVAAGRSE